MGRGTRIMALIGAGALVVGTPLTAEAGKPFERFHYEGTDSFDTTECGIPVHFEVTYRGSVVTRPVMGSDGEAYYAHHNYELTEVISTDAGYVTAHGRGVFLEQKAGLVEGAVWEFQALEASSFTLRDADGNLLLRAAGNVKTAEEFDTLGDGQPGGVPVPDTFRLLVENGLGFTDDEFCGALLAELT